MYGAAAGAMNEEKEGQEIETGKQRKRRGSGGSKYETTTGKITYGERRKQLRVQFRRRRGKDRK
jgi:hypothetical protein